MTKTDDQTTLGATEDAVEAARPATADDAGAHGNAAEHGSATRRAAEDEDRFDATVNAAAAEGTAAAPRDAAGASPTAGAAATERASAALGADDAPPTEHATVAGAAPDAREPSAREAHWFRAQLRSFARDLACLYEDDDEEDADTRAPVPDPDERALSVITAPKRDGIEVDSLHVACFAVAAATTAQHGGMWILLNANGLALAWLLLVFAMGIATLAFGRYDEERDVSAAVLAATSFGLLAAVYTWTDVPLWPAVLCALGLYGTFCLGMNEDDEPYTDTLIVCLPMLALFILVAMFTMLAITLLGAL